MSKKIHVILFTVSCFFVVLGVIYGVGSRIIDGDEKKEDGTDIEEGIGGDGEMTKEMENILRAYGSKEVEIATMKKEGLDQWPNEERFVKHALLMLDYLEKKYNQQFRVVGGGTAEMLSPDYWITAQAIDGEYAGEDFDVYYREDYGCRDGYITLLKQDEASKAFKDLVEGEFSDVQVYVEMVGEYGDEISLNMTGNQLIKTVTYDFIIVISDSTMSENDFNQYVEKISDVIKSNNIGSSGSIYCFDDGISSEFTMDQILDLLSKQSDENKVFIWDDYIATFRRY